MIAVIPCRTKSKGIPNKNFCSVAGLPLVQHAIDFAKSIDCFVVVTTDEQWVIDCLESVYHYRINAVLTDGSYLHSDGCSGLDVWRDAWKRYESEGPSSIYLEPSSPIRQPEDVFMCTAKLEHYKSAATVSETQKKFCPEKQIPAGERIVFPKGHIASRQSIPSYYHLNGVCYAARSIDVLDDFYADCAMVVTPHETVNIDDPKDLRLARFLLEDGEVF